jgi:hypothetical protein
MEPFLTKKQLAKMFAVNVQTIQKWARERKLPVLVLPNGQYRYERSKIEKFIKDRSIVVLMFVLFASCKTFNHIGTPCSKFESPCKHKSMLQYRPNH